MNIRAIPENSSGGQSISHKLVLKLRRIFLTGRSYSKEGHQYEQLWKRKEFVATHGIPTSLLSVNASIRPASVCIYAWRREGRRGGVGRTRGNPYVTSSPTRASARFVSLADFCRLTPKHPWTLPPPFTFNLYQSIQPSRRIERTSMNGTGRTGRKRHRALFTADSVFTPPDPSTSFTEFHPLTVLHPASLACPS